MSENHPCPICGQPTSLYDTGTTNPEQFFAEQPAYQIAASQKESRLPFYRCNQCGHGFAPLKLSGSAINDWYAKSPEDDVFLKDEPARRRTAQVALHHLSHHRTTPGTLLDIGAGPGLFLDEARQRGWKVEGLEPSQWAVEYAHRALHLETLRRGTFTDTASYPEHSFDVVTAFDVIEHIVEPADLLIAISRILKPGGILLLTTPRFDSVFARISGKKWHAIFPAHIHLFSSASLQQLLAKHGFAVTEEKTHTRYLGSAYFWHRLRSYLGFPSSSPLANQKSPLLPINLGDEIEIYARSKTS